jgi:hypothetical protein
VGKPEVKNQKEDLDEDGRIILQLREVGLGNVDWINLAQNLDQWWPLLIWK